MTTEATLAVRVGGRLREARLQSGLTVREVADRLGLKHAIIVKYENGTNVPSIDRLQDLAQIYRLTAAALLVEQDAAVPLFAMLDRADVSEIERHVRVLREELNT